jgi:hypothetical protein
MSTEQADPDRELQQPGYFTVFHLFGLIVAGVCAFGLAKDGWAAHGYLGLLGGLILGAVVAPVIFFVGFVVCVLGLLSLVFIAADEIPVGIWLARLRTILRGAIFAGGVAWIVHALPGLTRTTTWKEFYDAALSGLVFPCSAILCLFISRFEKSQKRGHQPE